MRFRRRSSFRRRRGRPVRVRRMRRGRGFGRSLRIGYRM